MDVLDQLAPLVEEIAYHYAIDEVAGLNLKPLCMEDQWKAFTTQDKHHVLAEIAMQVGEDADFLLRVDGFNHRLGVEPGTVEEAILFAAVAHLHDVLGVEPRQLLMVVAAEAYGGEYSALH